MKKKEAQVPPKDALAKPVSYALAQWYKMIRNLECEHPTPATNRVENAKANGVKPYWYLRALFDQIPLLDAAGDYDDLLPWNITIRKPEDY